MAKETWKPVLEILDRVCARLDFTYEVTYRSSDGNRIGLNFNRAYSQILDFSFEPVLMLDWSSKDVKMRQMSIVLDDKLFTELQRELSNANLVKQATLTEPATMRLNPGEVLQAHHNKVNGALAAFFGIPQERFTPIQSEPATMRAQAPAPTNAPKMPKWSRDQITFALLVGGFFVALFACIAAWLVVPQVQEVIQTFVHGTIPMLTPTLISPTATP
jgi:hypothetical protein